MKINEIRNTIENYFKKSLGKERSKIIKVSKIETGWEASVEVIEENEFIRSLGKYPTVYDRNIYEVELDEKGQIISYEKVKEQVAKESA